MPPRAIKHQLTCPFELTSGSFLIGRRLILVILWNHLDARYCWCNTDNKKTKGLVGLIGIACKYALDALEKESILLCKNGLQCFESVKDG